MLILCLLPTHSLVTVAQRQASTVIREKLTKGNRGISRGGKFRVGHSEYIFIKMWSIFLNINKALSLLFSSRDLEVKLHPGVEASGQVFSKEEQLCELQKRNKKKAKQQTLNH